MLALLEDVYGGDVDGDAPVEAALARLPPPRTPEMLLEKLLALGVRPGGRVLDVGCGHGQHAEQIASATGCTVVAVDLSPRYVTESRAAAGEVPSGRIHVARAIAEALPLRAASINFVWCRDMLYSVDLPRTLAECAAALVPGGQMVVYQSFARRTRRDRGRVAGIGTDRRSFA